mgnify:CR=1 FL=1
MYLFLCLGSNLWQFLVHQPLMASVPTQCGFPLINRPHPRKLHGIGRLLQCLCSFIESVGAIVTPMSL